jgi:hypothetical protein
MWHLASMKGFRGSAAEALRMLGSPRAGRIISADPARWCRCCKPEAELYQRQQRAQAVAKLRHGTLP